MTLNASTLKADKSAMKENVIHKLLINHMIYTMKDDTECVCPKVDKLVVKENVIHKPLINHMISTLKDDTECLYSKN